MTKRMRTLVLASLGLGLLTAAAVGDDLEAVQKKLQTAWEKQKSMTAKMEMTTHMEMGTMVMDGKGEGTTEFMRSGDKVLTRTELKNSMSQKMGEQDNKMEQSQLIVIDGDFAYALTDMMGRKQATKSKIDPKLTGEPKGLFEELSKQYELKLLPEETVDGQKTYPIEATSKEKGPMGMSRMVLYFHQDSGFIIKMVQYGAEDKPMTTMTYSDLKLDVKIDPEHFKFKLPEGVQLTDETAEKPPASQPATTQPAKPG